MNRYTFYKKGTDEIIAHGTSCMCRQDMNIYRAEFDSLTRRCRTTKAPLDMKVELLDDHFNILHISMWRGGVQVQDEDMPHQFKENAVTDESEAAEAAAPEKSEQAPAEEEKPEVPSEYGLDPLTERCIALYKLGFSDEQIAKRTDLTTSIITGWRGRSGLKGNSSRTTAAAEAYELADQNYSVYAIWQKTCLPMKRIAGYLENRKDTIIKDPASIQPVRLPSKPPFSDLMAAMLYKEKKTDQEIAAAMGFTVPTVSGWRQRTGRPRYILHNGVRMTMDEIERERKRLYHLGLSDEEIGQKTGFHPCTIQRWRDKNGLPELGKKEV